MGDSDKGKKKELKRKRKEEEKAEREAMLQQIKEMQENLNTALEKIARYEDNPPSPKRSRRTEETSEASEEGSSQSGSGSQTPSDNEGKNDRSREEEVARFLGANPDQRSVGKLEIHEFLAPRIREWIKSGLDKESKEEIFKTTPLVGDNLNLEPPELNEEVSYGLNESARKRDEHFRESHKVAGAAFAALATAVAVLFEDQEKPADRDEVVQLLANATMMISDLLHSNIVTRKAFITPAYEKRFKEVLENAESGKRLFGDKLGERFKDWQALSKTEAEIKAFKKTPFKPSNTNSVNWKRPSRQEANTTGRRRNYYNNASRKDGNKGSYRSTRTYTQIQPISHNRSRQHYNNQDHRRH